MQFVLLDIEGERVATLNRRSLNGVTMLSFLVHFRS